MGDNVIETHAQEALAKFAAELQRVLDQVKAEKAELEGRIRELEESLAKECKQREESDNVAEEYRRLAQKYYVQTLPKDLNQEEWENLDPADYTLTIDDLLAEIKKFER